MRKLLNWTMLIGGPLSALSIAHSWYSGDAPSWVVWFCAITFMFDAGLKAGIELLTGRRS